MRRVLLTVAVMAMSIGGLTLGAASQAGAAGVTITCTTISGSATTTVTISGCTGGNTGGKSQPLNGTALGTGGTITWVSGSTTTLGKPTLVSTSAKKCPGYVKGGTNNPTADKATVPVTGDTGDGIKVPGTAKGAICLYPNLSVSALKPLKIK
jgi:hypothetical protein